MRVRELADWLGATYEGDGEKELTGVAPLDTAGATDVSFVANRKAAQLAECSGKDKYFGVIDMIFATQQKWATSSDPIGELSKSLRIAGMGEAEARNCLANDAVANAVIADYRSGETLGVNSTPTLFINGELYKGARSVEELDAAFAKLAK